jgi:hypothetical protein
LFPEPSPIEEAIPSIDIFAVGVMVIMDSLEVQLSIVHCAWSPSAHFSQECDSGCIDTMDESELVATPGEYSFAELRMAAMLNPTPPPIANTIIAIVFQLVFMFDTLFLYGFAFAGLIVRRIHNGRIPWLFSYLMHFFFSHRP